MRDESAVPYTDDLHETSGLVVEGGIVAGRVTEYAEELDCTSGEVLDAIREEGIELMLDTAQDKGRGDHERPTDPALRCLAMRERDWVRLLLAVEGETDTERRAVPA